MKVQRSQTFKAGEDKAKSIIAKPRIPRQSEPYISQEHVDQLLSKGKKENFNEKLIRQGRVSEVVSPQIVTQNYYSPKTKKVFTSPTLNFLSPPHAKQQNKFIKCTSSNNLFFEAQPMNKQIKKGKQGLEQNKSRINVIENHKKTLDKIQQMLSSHGIQINGKNEKVVKEPEEKPKKVLKSPRYSEHLMPQHQVQFNRKETESFGNQKKTPKDHYLQTRQLKDTVSTNSTLKQVKQLKIGDFEIGREIGRGRFGVVKLVRHKKTGLVFAVKMIKKSVAKKQNIVDQIIKEIKIQYFLNQANIVKLYTVFDDPQNCYLLLELCCEGNLYQKVLKQHKFSENQARQILKNICEGLLELHTNKIIHRDLKPQNIVMNYGMAKICDFGWSTENRDSLRQTFCGTPLYVSPQLLKGNSYDEKVDLWSIGILGFEMLTGSIPFDIKTQKDLNKIIESCIEYPKGLSQQAKSFLQALLSKEPQKRSSISQLLHHQFFRKK